MLPQLGRGLAEQVHRPPHALRLAEPPVERQALLTERRASLCVAPTEREKGRRVKRLGPQRRVGVGRSGERSLEPREALLEVAAAEPEFEETDRDPQRQLRVRAVGPGEGRSQIRVVGLEPIEPRRAIRALHRLPERGRGLLGKRRKPSCVAAAKLLGVLSRLESLHPELADRLEHRVAAVVVLEQVPVDQTLELVCRSAGYGLGVLARATAGEHGEHREEVCLFGVQQIVAPLDRRAQGLVACRPVAGPLRQHGEPFFQPRGELGGCELPHAGRRELQGERKAVEGDADFGNCLRVAHGELEAVAHRRSTLDEEGDGLVLRQRLRTADVLAGRKPKRRHSVLVLAGQPQNRPARDQHGQPRRGGEQLAHHRRSGVHPLEVVDQQQGRPLSQSVLDTLKCGRAPLAERQRMRDRRRDVRRILERAQVDEVGPVGQRPAELPGGLDGKSRLSCAARPRERDEADVGPS